MQCTCNHISDHNLIKIKDSSDEFNSILLNNRVSSCHEYESGRNAQGGILHQHLD